MNLNGELEMMLTLLQPSSSRYAQLSASLYFRKCLANITPTSFTRNARLVSTLISCLTRDEIPELQLNAAWALTNIACGNREETHLVVENGGVPALSHLVLNSNGEVRDQAIWALGNIGADCEQCRSRLRYPELLNRLIELLDECDKDDSRRTLIWCLANVFRGGSTHLQAPTLRTVINCLAKTMEMDGDGEMIADAAWALAYLADDFWAGTHVQAIVDEPGLLARLMANLKRMNERRLVAGCLRCLGNVVTGNDQQTAAVLSLGVLPELLRLLATGWPQIKREAAWALSNVAAGPAEQIDQLLSVDSMLSQLLHVARHAELRTRKEAGWALANSLSGASAQLAGRLMVRGAMETLMELCKPEMDSRLVEAALSAVHSAIVKRPAIAVVISDYTESLQTLIDDLNSGPWIQQRAAELLGALADRFNESEPGVFLFSR